MASRKKSARTAPAEPGGLWHQPALMNLLADVLIVLAVAGLAWGALTALQRLPVFPLREIVLETTPRRVGADQIEHVARSSVVGNFFTVDLEAARQSFEKLPWVRKASLRRHWPDSIGLALEEHEAVARWRPIDGGQSGDGLVNRQGEVFRAEAPEDAGRLPLLSGPEGSAPELLRRHAEFSAGLATIQRRLDVLALSPRRAWRLRLDDGLTIELGRDQERHPLDERLARFIAHYDGAKGRLGTARTADMRYPNGFALSVAERGGAPARRETQEKKS